MILDFVPGAFCHERLCLTQFDGSALYEYPDADTGCSEWGSYNLIFTGRGAELSSSLWRSAAFWIEKYHLTACGWMPSAMPVLAGDAARSVNEGAVEFIPGHEQGLAERYPGVLRMAEDSTNFLKVTAPVKYDGLGFDYKWDK